MEAPRKPIKLLPLAFPKGVKYVCELCQGPAYLECPDCHVARYCSHAHMKTDVDSLHPRICHLLAMSREGELEDTDAQLASAVNADKIRLERRNAYLRELISVTEKIGRRHLCEANPANAIPAALQNLHCTAKLYGPTSIHLVLSYCMLCEASVGLNMLPQADNYLAQAQWLVVQEPSCPDSVKYLLYRAAGIIFLFKRQFNEARRGFADYIYYTSEAFGCNDIRTAGGYFLLAKVFNELSDSLTTESLLDRVTDIWCDHLTKLVRTVICGPAVRKTEPYNRDVSEIIVEDRCLDEADAAEAILELDFIYLMKNGPQRPDRVPKTTHCLAMLHFLREDGIKAENYGMLAMYETEDLPYRRDAEAFLPEYVEERKKMHAKLTEAANPADANEPAADHEC